MEEDAFPELSNFVLIGQGGYATVYSAVHTKSETCVAVKQVMKSNLTSTMNQRNLQSEVLLAKKVDHPFICSVLDVRETNEAYYFIMEFAENGSLLNHLNISGFMSMQNVRRVFAQMASVVYYLHEDRDIVHRDLKVDNILLDEYMNVRVCDFGLAKQLHGGSNVLSTLCGSYPYAAPEIFRNMKYGKPIDIWALGVCLYAMVVGRLPFNDDDPSKLVELILSSEAPIPVDVPSPVADLIQRMLTKDPEKRITIEGIVHHPWIAQSEYRIYFDKRFLNCSLFQVNPTDGLDPEVAKHMRDIGFKPMKCMERGSEEWVIYRLFRKRKIGGMANRPLYHIEKSAAHRPAVAPMPEVATLAKDMALKAPTARDGIRFQRHLKEVERRSLLAHGAVLVQRRLLVKPKRRPISLQSWQKL